MSRYAQNDDYAAQTNPTPDTTLTLTLTLILTSTQPFVLSLRAILKTLHVRAIIRLVWAVMCCVRAGHVTAGGSLPGMNNK